MTPLAQAHSEESTRYQILVAALQVENVRLREGHINIQANLTLAVTLAEQKRVETTTQMKKMEDMHRVNLLEQKVAILTIDEVDRRDQKVAPTGRVMESYCRRRIGT